MWKHIVLTSLWGWLFESACMGFMKHEISWGMLAEITSKGTVRSLNEWVILISQDNFSLSVTFSEKSRVPRNRTAAMNSLKDQWSTLVKLILSCWAFHRENHSSEYKSTEQRVAAEKNYYFAAIKKNNCLQGSRAHSWMIKIHQQGERISKRNDF